MTRVGLVLGAGGMVGQAYHAGVLAALAEHTGWDPRRADRIVGSSAGSVTGAVLRLGGSAPDLASFAADRPLSPEGAALFATFGPRERDFPPFEFRSFVQGWRPPTARLAARAIRKPRTLRATSAVAAMMPPGRIDITEHTAVLDREELEGTWPAGLLVCAARRDDGRRVVFGRPRAPQASLAQAVAASCAIPGYFAPVRIARTDYVDGGIHSPTNADVLVRERLDLVVVVSPMSARAGRSRTPDALMRLAMHRRLQGEVRRLRAAGIPVIAFEPEGPELSVMGINAMAQDRGAAVVDAAAETTLARLERGRLADRLDLLSSAHTATRAA